MRSGLRHEHGNIAPNRRKRGQRAKGFLLPASREDEVKIQFRHQHGIAQIIAFRQGRQKLAQFAQSLLAELDGSRFEEERGALSSANIVQSAQAELFEEFLKQTFQIMHVEAGVAGLACPEDRIALAG